MPKRTLKSDLASTSNSVLSDARYSRLLRDVQRLIETANSTSDQAKVTAHWQLGEHIERERPQAKTGYHNSILRDLSGHLGMAIRTLQYAVKRRMCTAARSNK